MTNPAPLTVQRLNEIEARAAYLEEYATLTDEPLQADADQVWGKDVPALLAMVRRLQGQRKYLLTQLAKRDAETGRGDRALREFLTAHPGEDVEQPAVEESEACAKCRQPFDAADTRFDGHARYHLTPYCRGCVDRCHDNEIADHRCVICA